MQWGGGIWGPRACSVYEIESNGGTTVFWRVGTFSSLGTPRIWFMISAYFVVGRLEIYVRALTNFAIQLEGLRNDEIREVREAVFEIKDSCTLLHGIWQSRMDEIDTHDASSGYQAPSVNTRGNGRGRPQLLITQDQLEYLQFQFFLDSNC